MTSNPADTFHQEILATSPPFEEHSFLITTDGSALDGKHIPQAGKGLGGAWVLRPQALTSPAWRPFYAGAVGLTAGSVQRAEMMGLLEGLRMAATLLNLTNRNGLRALACKDIKEVWQFPPERRQPIWWVGDRENLVLQVARRAQTNEPYYQRSTELDLWPQLNWYEHIFRITATHQPRCSDADMRTVDQAAGEVRSVMLRQYKKMNPLDVP